MRAGETTEAMKSILLKFVVGAAALCGLAVLLLCALALGGRLLAAGPEALVAFDPLSAVSLLLLTIGVLLARIGTRRRPGRLISALGGFLGLGLLFIPSEMAPATAAALLCYGAASLLFLLRLYGLGQAVAAIAFLPSLGSVIGYLLGTYVLFGRPPVLVLLTTVLCGLALLGGTAHRGSIRVFLSKTISGTFA